LHVRCAAVEAAHWNRLSFRRWRLTDDQGRPGSTEEHVMIHALRLLHILSGAFWFGALLFSVRFVMPSLRAVGPAAGPVMAQLNQRGITAAFMGAAIVNLASGIWLTFIVSGGAPGAWMKSGMGRTIGAGAACAILALLVGMIVNPPAVKRMGQIAAAAAKRGGPPSPEEAAEIQRLQQRMARGNVFVAILLTLAISAMAVARYT
jgi:uncharacterized membrane protein